MDMFLQSVVAHTTPIVMIINAIVAAIKWYLRCIAQASATGQMDGQPAVVKVLIRFHYATDSLISQTLIYPNTLKFYM